MSCPVSECWYVMSLKINAFKFANRYQGSDICVLSKSTLLLFAFTLIYLLFSTNSIIQAQSPQQEITIDVHAVTIEWSPDGSLIALGTENGVWIYTTDLQFVTTLPDYTQQVVSLSWSPDSQRLAGVGYPYQAGVELYVPVFTSSLLIWQRGSNNNFSLIQRFDYPEQANIVRVEWSPTGTYLASVISEYLPRSDTAFGDIEIRDTSTPNWEIVSHLQNSYRAMYADVAWSPDGSLIASGAEAWCYELRPCNMVGEPVNGTIVFLANPTTGERVSYAYTGLPTHGISWSLDNQIAVAAAEIRIYDSTLTNILYENTSYRQYGLKWMPNQTELLLWSYDGEINIIDSTNFESRFSLTVPNFQALSLSPANNQIVILNNSHTIAMYNLAP
jgi:WD40 repeat protein